MTLEDWIAQVADELELTDLEIDTDSMHILLDLARDAAHAVQRPAAPLTTFLVGVAVGRGASLGAAAARVTELAVADGGDHLGDGAADEDADVRRSDVP